MTIQFLEDLTDAIEQYPHEYLTIEIVNVSYPGRFINRQEDVDFYFQVSNRGPLVARELSFLIEGLNGTQVKGSSAAGHWVNSGPRRPLGSPTSLPTRETRPSRCRVARSTSSPHGPASRRLTSSASPSRAGTPTSLIPS